MRTGLYGLKSRKAALAFEIFCLIPGLLGFIAGDILLLAYLLDFIKDPLTLALFVIPSFLAICFFAPAYWYAVAIRWVDKAGIW